MRQVITWIIIFGESLGRSHTTVWSYRSAIWNNSVSVNRFTRVLDTRLFSLECYWYVSCFLDILALTEHFTASYMDHSK